MQHDYQDLIRIFNDLFLPTLNTELVAGDGEPIYLPADAQYPHHRIVFANHFYSSALHEIGHWLVAGPERRLLEDFGYWYKPDGRTAEEQIEFERVEVKPQANEWMLSVAAGHPFHFSADNLSTGLGASHAFKCHVQQRVWSLLDNGLPERLRVLVERLTAFYGRAPLQRDCFSIEQ
ncbi:elongation factor P hydroxylase [Salinispirillum sp. LH 10-3-1]|uniref:elongation factor P hydroxylase n=1 Tax=Salinispirillum sp. LH 10-3-1 TaxID=2952525 RepID=UPI00272C90DA